MVTSRSTFPHGVPPHCDSLHHGRGPINYRPMTKPTTLGELKQTEWASPARIHRTVKDELRENLICPLENGSPLFPGIVGYEDSVIPQLVNAVLSRHNFILLGLRGQAKSRILRQLVTLLDEEIPILAGSEVNDNPFAPISKYGRERVTEQGAGTPIAWLPRESRFVEKLATPDVTIADIIGDVDPIKAARGGHLLSDELTMHFGLLPRANRGIFAINELPDLAGKIQVGLFNIMQEGDVQIKGYPVRLNVDVALVFTANPEDYTARGKIITPLKDRIGSGIVTHYPHTVELGGAITRQESWLERNGRPLKLPDFMLEVIAKDRIRRAAGKTFEARVGGANVDDIVHWFDEGGALKISMDERSETCLKGFSVVPGLLGLIAEVGLAAKKDPGTMVAASELVLEGLVAEKRISRSEELGYTRVRGESKGPGYGKTGGSGGPNLFQ